MTITRFAPSPTGRLHAGNIRTALVNWLLTRQAGGRFVLRLDDTDLARSSEESAQSIRDDLGWLGLTPDAEVRQSDRFALYDAALERLAADGRAYPAWETPEQLDLKRKVALSRGLPPVYDRAALALTEAEQAALRADGVAPHWRFKLDAAQPIHWHDGVRGDCRFDPATLSDPVVRRADGTWLYMLPSVVDDIDLGITDIVRGEDHVTNSAVQIQMFEALGAPVPRLAHLALLTGKDAALSKRLGSEGVVAWKEAGFEAAAIRAYLARVGSAHPFDCASMDELIAEFDLSKFGRAPAIFDPPSILFVNTRTVHRLSYSEVAERLPTTLTEEGWLAIRPNLKIVEEADELWEVIAHPIRPILEDEDEAYVAEARRVLETLEWNQFIWSRWTAALKDATGRKGRALFQPLRQALTGRDHGPEMAALLPLIGRDAALARLLRPV